VSHLSLSAAVHVVREVWLIAIASLAFYAAARGDESASSAERAGPTIRWNASDERVEIVGLAPEFREAVAAADLTRKQWNLLFQVSVVDERGRHAAPMLGRHVVDGPLIAFAPRFPLRPGLRYLAVFDPTAVALGANDAPARLETIVSLPAAPPQATTVVEAVYPSGEELPENLLKFYVHFSAPMGRGDSYKYVRIVDGDGREVTDAILEIGEELWDAEQRRLTLLFDPGRIKRGLKPNEEVGSPLLAGREYALVIDAEWRDAQGAPLGMAWRRGFRVMPPDDQQPDPHRWSIKAPAAGTRDALAVQFDEPLDRALLDHMLTVRHADGDALLGLTRVDHQETRWRFEPDAPWAAGRYVLSVDPALEDRAGNSVGRPFEVLDGTANSRPPLTDKVELPFDISAP
jgi:hypothetical protein